MKTKLKIVLFLMFFVVLAPQTFGATISGFTPPSPEAGAAFEDSYKNTLISPSAELPGNASNCFDYFHFDSVWVDAPPAFALVNPGTILSFSGTVKNDNTYPVVDGSIYVRIFRRQTDEKKQMQNGDNAVDQFFLKDTFNLASKSSLPVNFIWKVPNAAVRGEYYASYYFISQKQFNILGFPFLENVSSGVFSFSVEGAQNTGVAFDKNTITLNGKPDVLIGLNPRFKKNETVTVNATIKNATDQNVSVPIQWKLSTNNGVSESDKISSTVETVSLAPGESKNVTYVVTDTAYPVYYLTAEADFRDTKSFLNIRLVREGIDGIKIHFPAISSYPLRQGEKNVMFSCLFNSGADTGTKSTKLVLTILDPQGNTIEQHDYQTTMDRGTIGVKYDFTPKETLNTFTLNAKLYREDGSLSDSATMHYTCKDLQKNCTEPSAAIGGADHGRNRNECSSFGGRISHCTRYFFCRHI